MSGEILLVTATATEAFARIGGEPLLPPDTAWPVHRWPLAEVETWPDYARDELELARAKGAVHDEGDELVMPLPFLALVDLAGIAHGDDRLPDTGLLLFFAATLTNVADERFAKRVAAAVLYVEDATSATARPHPVTADPPPGKTRALRAQPVDEPRRDVHALLPAREDELAGPMPPPGYVALLRLHEDPGAELFIGDASWLTFVIAEDDLRARRFDRACASVFIG